MDKPHKTEHVTKEYNAWRGIKKRCCDENNPGYKNYGGRGIGVCRRWLASYKNFLADMGRAPTPKHSIDRINNNLGYKPSNCKWATAKDQTNNKRTNIYVTIRGVQRTLKQACEQLDVRYSRVWYRIKILKWPLKRALRESRHHTF